VTAQLIDAENDTHLWAERFDGDTSDLFALQDEITSRIAVTLNVELIAAAAGQATENPQALEYFLRGRAAGAKPKTRANHAEAITLYEHALALDRHFVAAQSRLAAELAGRVLNNMTDSRDADIARAEELAERALTAEPRGWLAHYAKGQVLRAQARFVEAIPEYETVIELNRNQAYAISCLGQCKYFTGSLEDSIALQEQFIRLSPRDPLIGMAYIRTGEVYLLQSRLNDAIVWLEKARRSLPEHPHTRALLASAYARDGAAELAAAELAEARRLSGDDSYSSIAHMRMGPFRKSMAPKVRALYEAIYEAGLRKAGVPEE